MQPGDLCTYADVVSYMPPGQNLNQTVVERLITSASAAISRVADREFATLDATEDEGTVTRTSTTRRFAVNPYPGTRLIPVGDMATEPTRIDLLDEDQAATSEDITLAKINPAPLQRRPWEPITGLSFPTGVLDSVRFIDVTAEWGFPEVPDDVRQACIAQVREWYVRDVSRLSLTLDEATAEGTVAPSRELARPVLDLARGYQSYAEIAR